MSNRGSRAEALEEAVSALAPVDLDTVLRNAELQVRVDRKYLVTSEQLAALLSDRPDEVRMLEIDGRRWTEYKSVYFDTPDRALYRMAATGRPFRSKVRTRRYGQHGMCMLEVKTRTRGGTTAKYRQPHPAAGLRRLTTADVRFVEANLPRPVAHEALSPVLRTTYRRATLLIDGGAARVTLDAEVTAAGHGGRSAHLRDVLVLETKSSGPPTGVDRRLWRQGIRPVALSKFCVGLASIEHLPANRWARLMRRYVDVGDLAG